MKDDDLIGIARRALPIAPQHRRIEGTVVALLHNTLINITKGLTVSTHPGLSKPVPCSEFIKAPTDFIRKQKEVVKEVN